MEDYVICFDLDDTLYKEIDYLKSAYKEIAESVGHPEAAGQMLDWYQAGENSFKKLIETYGLTVGIADLLKKYREHYPNIHLGEGVKEFLTGLKENGAKLGLISDGRSLTQRNKITALGLEGFFDIEIISEEFGSEKPCLKNYQIVMEKFPERKVFIYVGDNTTKDFVAPNQLGWRTVLLAQDKSNIHRQNLSLAKEYMPQRVVKSIREIII
jgi:putative hydrolase of the HAD superfamily